MVLQVSMFSVLSSFALWMEGPLFWPVLVCVTKQGQKEEGAFKFTQCVCACVCVQLCVKR